MMSPKIKLFLFLFTTILLFAKTTDGSVQAQQPQGSLLFEPEVVTVGKGQLFDVNINVDTFGNQAGGVGAKIQFDPEFVNVISVIPGSIFADYPSAAFDNTSGTAVVSGIVGSPDSLFSGTGVFAQLKFLPVSSGTTTITFEFEPGSTTDSNIAITKEPWDALTQVNTLELTISESGKAIEVTPPVNSSVIQPISAQTSQNEPGFFQKLYQKITSFFGIKTTETPGSSTDLYGPITRQEPNASFGQAAGEVPSSPLNLNYRTLSYIMLGIIALTVVAGLIYFMKKKKKDDEPPTIVNL